MFPKNNEHEFSILKTDTLLLLSLISTIYSCNYFAYFLIKHNICKGSQIFLGMN